MKTPIKNVRPRGAGPYGRIRGGYVTDVQMSKRRLFDERSSRDVLADTTVTVVVRYCLRRMERVRKPPCGSDRFSVFEQEGAVAPHWV